MQQAERVFLISSCFVLVLFNSYLLLLQTLCKRTEVWYRADGLRPFRVFQFNVDDHKKRLLVLGLGLLPLKWFLLRINKQGALARLWTASCIKLQCFPCLGRFHNFFLIMHEVCFHLYIQALYFFFSLAFAVYKDLDFNENTL